MRFVFFFSSRRRHTRYWRDWSSDVCSSDLGKPLNSPNDIVVKSDDSVWFTDPPFGILGNYEGHVATPELPTNVYRLDKSGQLTVATGDVRSEERRVGKECRTEWSQ